MRRGVLGACALLSGFGCGRTSPLPPPPPPLTFTCNYARTTYACTPPSPTLVCGSDLGAPTALSLSEGSLDAELGNSCVGSDPAPLQASPILVDTATQKINDTVNPAMAPLMQGCHTESCPCTTYVGPQCPIFDPAGCNFWYVDPFECSQLAFVNGYQAYSQVPDPIIGSNSFRDGDSHIDVVPISSGAWFGDAPLSNPVDPRDSNSCDNGGNNLLVSTERQWCRWLGGPVSEPEDAQSWTDFRASDGERVSFVGDWVVDPHGQVEIHESRLNVTVRRDTGNPDVYHLLTSAFFPNAGEQMQGLAAAVPIPPPSSTSLSVLSCRTTALEGTHLDNGGCHQSETLSAVGSAVTSNGVVTSGTASLTINPSSGSAPSEWFCGSTEDVDCPCQGGGDSDGQDCASFTYDSYDRCNPPSLHGGAGSHLVAVDVRCQWIPDPDLWLCTCACDDPSSPGATINALLQGCSGPVGEDAESPEALQAACAQACGGTMCGGAPNCRIGSCGPVAGDVPVGQLLVPEVCSADAPGVRAARAADYRVDLDPAASTMAFGQLPDGGSFQQAGTTSVSGQIWINFVDTGGEQSIEVAGSSLSAADTTTNGFSLVGSKAFSLTRFTATRVPFAFDTYAAPAGSSLLAMSSFVNGGFTVGDFQTQGGFTVTWIPGLDVFGLAATASDPSGDAVMLTLVGKIADHPPRAVAGPDQTVQCTSEAGALVTLDGTASSDPDPGDFISHYQWFEADAGVSNQGRATVQASIGAHDYELHVYDGELGSDSAHAHVSVIDTVAPTLDVQPANACLWPPDHRFALFVLGQQIQYTVSDPCDPNPLVWIDSVVSDEPALAAGSGQTTPDVVHGTQSACVRAERAGPGEGRTYRVTVKARDFACNMAERTIVITVPHDDAAHPDCLHAGGTDVAGPECTLGSPVPMPCIPTNG